ncbi:3-hydroxyacyl-CoA dehydrogenase NAD-binding domain-containing protein [Pigmentiphaga soli]|uniref:3-hydroxyacyl-CoA dehydrogenase NAD-binding domain-containing protein n=1 Tax=Pigmentiphaga soli TaxID=1007095 RepID=A0ABP8GZY4_9BURK
MNDAAGTVTYGKRGRVAIVTIDNPPLNALGPGIRESIVDRVREANADGGIEAIVLAGAGRHFIAGADIRQFGKARAMSSSTSAAALAASAKPVVAAIDGYCLGGGLEHALACHYRIATTDARLGLPEVKLGLIPGAGGTQRLPRLVGIRNALDIILSGRHVAADEALELGLVTKIVEPSVLLDAAVDFAAGVAAVRPLPSVDAMETWREADRRDPHAFDAAEQLASRQGRHLKGPRYAVELVRASLQLPLEEGIRLEGERFAELENSEESRALRYAFFAERTAAKIPGAPPGYVPPRVERPAVIGAGTMGSGIAIAFADAGVPVRLLEADGEALQRGMQRIAATYAAKLKRKTITQEEIDARMALIRPVAGYHDIADCDAVIEAVFERIDVKREVFARLDEVMNADALLLTNSSAIDIDTIAAATRRPQSVAGSHFFAPANVMKLCEIVKGDASSIQTILRAARMGRDLGKISVVTGSCDGFAANRSRAPLVTEMMLLLEEGALPGQVDKVMTDFGYPMGPFAVSDLSGLDISYDTRKRRAAADPGYRKLYVPDRLVEMGRKGQKVGAGWYRYEPGDRTPRPDPVVAQVIAEVARELGIPQRTFTDDEILRRLLFASVNEACKIVQEGKALRASDIDVMWLNGFGFPRHRGGLLYWADGIGAAAIHRQVCEWHELYGKRWKPAGLLAGIAAAGGRLRDAVAP